MIEWRFGLPPLTVRDQTANNLAEVLDFASPDVSAPAFTVPTGPFGAPCLPAPITSKAGLNSQLKALAIRSGFQGVR
jgi:phospholipase C